MYIYVQTAFPMPKTKPFDQYSDGYDEWFDAHHEVYQAELETIGDMIPSLQPKGFDVGVGSGRFAAPLEIKIGVKPSEEMAIRTERCGIQVFHAVAESLPFGNPQFDLVLMVTTICFVDDLLKSFKEASRVPRPFGYIIVGFVGREGELARQYSRKCGSSVFYNEATSYSAKEVDRSLEVAGFRKVQCGLEGVGNEENGRRLSIRCPDSGSRYFDRLANPVPLPDPGGDRDPQAIFVLGSSADASRFGANGLGRCAVS
jgi:SAM-dependent methyltransferase